MNEKELMDKKIIERDWHAMDPKECLEEVWRRKYLIAVILIFCLLISVFYTKFLCTPQYVSCSKIYISNTMSDKLSSNDISIATYLTRDYAELIVDRTVLEEVIGELGIKYSYGGLKSAVTIINPENTRILEVYVQTPNASLSRQIADKICEVAQTKIIKLMGVDRVNIISRAYLPSSPSGPNMKMNAFIALIFGGAISILLVLFLYFSNDRLNGSTDVEKYLQISVLGTIPFNHGRTHSTDTKRRAVRN